MNVKRLFLYTNIGRIKAFVTNVTEYMRCNMKLHYKIGIGLTALLQSCNHGVPAWAGYPPFAPGCSPVNFHVLADIESSNGSNPQAYRLDRLDVGLYQITPPVLDEYNRHHTHQYTKPDLLDNTINTRIAKWYMDVRIPQLLHHFGLPDTTNNRLICWNGGIRAAIHHHLTKITTKYIRTYERLIHDNA